MDLKGARRGRFVLLHKLGEGGMGAVYAAYDEQLDRKVALKLLRQAQAGSEVQRLRTLREARAAVRVSHPNIIDIYEVGEFDGNIHIAMEYVGGGTLLDWQTAGERSWRDILHMYLQVGAALHAAHEAEVVHRDFKPDNVLIGWDERPRVADFGLARLGFGDENDELVATDESPDAQSTGRLTRPGVALGTPGYMSPEHCRGDDVDSRSDQWSFCAALYEALYGHLPFFGSNLKEYERSLHEPPQPPPRGTQVPDELRHALCRGMSPDPGQRFPSIAALCASLDQELRGGATAGTLSRQRFSRIFIGAVLLALVVLQLRHSPSGAPPRPTGLTWVALIGVVLFGGLVHRQTLLRQRFHQHMWLLILITVLLFFLQRVVGWAFGMTVRQLYAFQMLTAAGLSGIVAVTLVRKLIFLPMIPLLACLLSVVTDLPQRALTMAYPLIAIFLAIGWSQAAKPPPRNMGEAESMPNSVTRPRRPPSPQS